MTHLRALTRIAGLSSLVALCACLSFATEKTNFSGTYSLRGRVGKPVGAATANVSVVQKEDAIEITRTQENKKQVRVRLPLNGDEGSYANADGVPGRGKARLKGRDLLLDSDVDNSPKPGAPAVATHTHERWRLSADSKILTIKYDVDWRVGLSNSVTESWTETYVRKKR